VNAVWLPAAAVARRREPSGEHVCA